MSKVRGLQISSAAASAVLTPEQKRFNALIGQIEQARQTLAGWRDNIPLVLQVHTQRIVPLLAELTAAQREWVVALDHLLDQPGWTRAERDTLRELVCDGVTALIDAEDEPDPELKALFDKHSEVDYDTEQREARLAMKGLVEAVTGLDLGDVDDIASEEDLVERMHQAQAAQTEQREAARARAKQSGARRGKTAAEKRREADAQLATQSVREIFRKLASALHPDRETDPVQREAKTALMQRVNQAYAGNDLLTLLELQLQIEQIDVNHVAGVSAQRVKQYNKLLAEQLTELKHEIARTQVGFARDFDVEVSWNLNPAKLGGLIDKRAKKLRSDLAWQQRELRMLADKVATRRWLKSERRIRSTLDDALF